MNDYTKNKHNCRASLSVDYYERLSTVLIRMALSDLFSILFLFLKETFDFKFNQKKPP